MYNVSKWSDTLLKSCSKYCTVSKVCLTIFGLYTLKSNSSLWSSLYLNLQVYLRLSQIDDGVFPKKQFMSFNPWLSLRKKCSYSEIFWSVFCRIRTEYGEILGISSHSVWMPENLDQKNSEYGQFFCSGFLQKSWCKTCR